VLIGAAVTPGQPADPAPPPAAEAPWRRLLTGDDAKRVAALEKQADDLEAAGEFARAQAPAREIAAIRARLQGATHW
jgi:hypothetical protein